MSAFLSPSPTPFILATALSGCVWAYYQYTIIAQTKVNDLELSDSSLHGGRENARLKGIGSGVGVVTVRNLELMKDVYERIEEGAEAFLSAEYEICFRFCVAFSLMILVLISWGQTFGQGFLTAMSFLLGAGTSTACGYIGMKVAVFSNVRTTINAQQPGFKDCFNTAFRAGAVMGFALTGLGIFVMYVTMCGYSVFFDQENWAVCMDVLSGYALGGSTIAMFGRVGGGIYTKAADVGADLCGKVINDLPEDSPRNPATIADNVGDNVGDVAGMGADLFGSFAESTCAALIIAAQTDDLRNAGWGAICFPVAVSCAGIIVCIFTSFFATHISPVVEESHIEAALRNQLVISTVLMIPASFAVAHIYLPATFHIDGVSKSMDATRFGAVTCIISGGLGGLIIGLVTEYYTSKEYKPVQELVYACKNGGAATNIIYGLALGYKSTLIPTCILATIIYTSFELCDLYGVALAAVGMLGNLATGLTIDAYGPVTDNAGGIAEMSELPESVRDKTDALDAAGNTTAAVGKGFAIGSAALVSLALFGAFVVRIRESSKGMYDNVMILQPLVFAFLLVGSMLPYLFSAMTMKSVGDAAQEMVQEVKRQFDANPNLLKADTLDRPDYKRCIEISTQASLREMIAPGALVLFTPLVVGTFFGVFAVYGLLTGALLSSVQLAISMSNTGGAWDNCKKLVKSGTDRSLPKGSEEYEAVHKAAVIGDTVGDPLKDTSGPALNIVMKLMAIMSLVFADFFFSLNQGQGLLKMPIA